MATGMEHAQVFVAAVVSHMVTILAGCGATVILDQLRRFAKRKKWIVDDWPDMWWLYIMLAFLSFASFQAWQDQYTSNMGRRSDVEARDRKIGELSTSYSQSSAKSEALQSQIQSQQQTINNALLALGKFQPDPLRIIGSEIRGILPETPRLGFKYALVYVVTTNRTITPIRLLVTCEADSIEADGQVLGTGTVLGGGWGGRVTGKNNQFGIGITSPAWSPTNPMVVTVYSNYQRFGVCSFQEQ